MTRIFYDYDIKWLKHFNFWGGFTTDIIYKYSRKTIYLFSLTIYSTKVVHIQAKSELTRKHTSRIKVYFQLLHGERSITDCHQTLFLEIFIKQDKIHTNRTPLCKRLAYFWTSCFEDSISVFCLFWISQDLFDQSLLRIRHFIATLIHETFN